MIIFRSNLKSKVFGVFFSLIVLNLFTVKSQTWSPIGPGFMWPNNMYDFIEYNGELYASGTFIGSGSTYYEGVARWDGVNWQQVGGSSYTAVLTMAVYNGDLIVAGMFNYWHNAPLPKSIARWDGTSWHPMGIGLTYGGGWINDMAVYDGKLYVVGWFEEMDNNPNIKNIAVWDGTSWSSPCTTSGGLTSIQSAAVFNNELYIGGFLGHINGVTCYNIAKFDGTSWGPVGPGLNSVVKSLFADTINQRLYAVGNFFGTVGSSVQCPSNVAYWDGSDWNAFGTTVSPLYPEVIYVHKNEVYVGTQSRQYNMSGDTLNAIARWDGTDWQPLGKGLRSIDSLQQWVGSAHGLLTYNGQLAVAGSFNYAGDTYATLVASWDDTPIGLTELEPYEKDVSIYPNPFKDVTTIKLSSRLKQQLPFVFELHDEAGRLVLKKNVHVSEFEISGQAYSAGIYYFSLKKNKQKIAAGNMVIE